MVFHDCYGGYANSRTYTLPIKELYSYFQYRSYWDYFPDVQRNGKYGSILHNFRVRMGERYNLPGSSECNRGRKSEPESLPSHHLQCIVRVYQDIAQWNYNYGFLGTRNTGGILRCSGIQFRERENRRRRATTTLPKLGINRYTYCRVLLQVRNYSVHYFAGQFCWRSYYWSGGGWSACWSKSSELKEPVLPNSDITQRNAVYPRICGESNSGSVPPIRQSDLVTTKYLDSPDVNHHDIKGYNLFYSAVKRDYNDGHSK